MAKSPRVIVAGGGPVGLYTAHALAKANIDYVLLEQQPEIVRYKGAGIVLLPQTARLCDQLGILKQMQEPATRLHSKTNSLYNGQQLVDFRLFEPMEEDHGYPTLGLSRSEMIEILYKTLPERETRVKTNARVIEIESNANGVRVYLADGSVEEGSLVIGVDGAHSRTRDIMDRLIRESTEGVANREPYPMVTYFKAIFGRAPVPKGVDIGRFYEAHGNGVASQTVPGKKYAYFSILRKLPTPTTARHRYSEKELEEEVKSFADLHLFPNITFGEIWKTVKRDEVSLVHLEEGIIDKWHHGRIVLLGDSVHKMTPISGMGVNTGMQSAAVLVNQLQNMISSGSEFTTEALNEAFESYQKIQEPVCRMTVMQGEMMTRMVTWNTWTAWLFDRFIVPWMDLEGQVKKQFSPIISNTFVLDYVPFEGKAGQVPWVNGPKVKV
ncbi:putative dehydrogenase [Annulohypoxylon maeteangense]|uniref:putative dehydrogenase n=1 Tax=Annulohypoxylon maeteangense TaxID=1927788 RepID=UPI0020074630|nr:putative dehydrogenase [Annulohypoxylon maeteangense]KAI0884187.1 putative dehydrogenase [Annulohypoxylon maeteangense]